MVALLLFIEAVIGDHLRQMEMTIIGSPASLDIIFFTIRYRSIIMAIDTGSISAFDYVSTSTFPIETMVWDSIRLLLKSIIPIMVVES